MTPHRIRITSAVQRSGRRETGANGSSRVRLRGARVQGRRLVGVVGKHPADGLRVPAVPALRADALGVQHGGNLAVGQFVLVPQLPGAGPAGLRGLLRGEFFLVGAPAVWRGAVGVPALVRLLASAVAEPGGDHRPLQLSEDAHHLTHGVRIGSALLTEIQPGDLLRVSGTVAQPDGAPARLTVDALEVLAAAPLRVLHDMVLDRYGDYVVVFDAYENGGDG
jgi:hypothetical protein